MTQRRRDARLGMAFRLREFLGATEKSANRTRKYLRDVISRMPAERLGAMDDAVKLAELIEELAHKGQTLPAEEAFDLAEMLENLIGQLRGEVDAILTS